MPFTNEKNYCPFMQRQTNLKHIEIILPSKIILILTLNSRAPFRTLIGRPPPPYLSSY